MSIYELVPVCPGKLCLAHNLSRCSQNLTNWPMRALSVLKSDNLSHNQTVCLMHIVVTCETCVMILLLPWLLLYTLSWSQTICLIVRDCLITRQSVACTSCYRVKLVSDRNIFELYTLSWIPTIYLTVRQSVSKLDNLSHHQTNCPAGPVSVSKFRQTV